MIGLFLFLGIAVITLLCLWITLWCYVAVMFSDDYPPPGVLFVIGLVVVGTWVLWWVFVGSSIHLEIGVKP